MPNLKRAVGATDTSGPSSDAALIQQIQIQITDIDAVVQFV